MTIAHAGGVPVEEWLAALAVTGSGVGIALRATLRRLHRRP